MGRRVKEEGESECRSVIDRIRVEPPGEITLPERGQTSLWSSVTREPWPTDSGRQADMSAAGNTSITAGNDVVRLARAHG